MKLLTHSEADYRASTFPHRRCGTCSMFTSFKSKPAKCSLVQQPIRPYMVCKHFEPMGGKHADEKSGHARSHARG